MYRKMNKGHLHTSLDDLMLHIIFLKCEITEKSKTKIEVLCLATFSEAEILRCRNKVNYILYT